MLSKTDIRDALRAVGLRGGDHLVVHSSLRSVGPVEGGPEGLIEALLEALGPGGTLAMPVFNYTRPAPEPYFDPAVTPGKTGALTEIFRRRPGTLRSVQPTHSMAACGPRAAEFLADHMKHQTFGVGSPLDRLAAAGGYVLLLGVTHLSNSTIHVGESHAGVVKFGWEDGPPPVARVLLPDGRVVDHELDNTSSCSMAFNAAEHPLRRAGQIIDLRLGPALCFLMKGRDIIARVKEMIADRPDALMCTRQACRPCRLAREHLRAKR